MEKLIKKYMNKNQEFSVQELFNKETEEAQKQFVHAYTKATNNPVQRIQVIEPFYNRKKQNSHRSHFIKIKILIYTVPKF